jgi:tetratricopeptide (TPR) repeat protein
MRILFLCNPWAVTREPARLVGTHPDLRDGRHQWTRAIGGPAVIASDISYDLRRDTVRDIAARCPGGDPDVMIVWAPGYQALPLGIEDAPFPVVACYSDWPLLMPELAGSLDAYDYLFACRGGVRTLNHMGYQNVEYWPMYGHDPLLSRVIPGVEKRWDIGLVGNLSAVVQRERAPWLERVARLADRYRVRIAGGIFNEQYTQMLNATKITFNRAFRITLNNTFDGAMNMRCYEAAACGSLLFCEEENEEIRDFFEDRVHCVLYNEENLEELLEYYLQHDEERERICAAAVERVAEFSLPRSLVRLADRLEALDLPAQTASRRDRLRSVPATSLWKRQARQMVGALTSGAREAGEHLLQQAVAADDADPAACNDLAVIRSLRVGETAGLDHARELTSQSLQLMRDAIERCPGSAFFRLNLAEMYADTGWTEAALELTQEALGLLDTMVEEAADPFCLPFPMTWSEFRVQYSLIYNVTRSCPEQFASARRCLLLHRAGLLLGRLAEQQGLTPLAELGYRVAVAARADLGSGHASLARVLASVGEKERALEHLDAALQHDPFMTDSWVLGVRLLLERGDQRQAEAFAAERLTMLQALVPPQERHGMGAALSDLEETRQALIEVVQARPAAA